MAIPSRQIGWGTEDNLLWQISKQLERLTQVTGNSIVPTTTSTTTLPVYQVFTALLTQSGGDSTGSINFNNIFPLVVGVTYNIVGNLPIDEGGTDFTNVGAPNNDTGTSFIATGTTPVWGQDDGQLTFNEGAPVATVLENTIGNVWFEYFALGIYSLNSENLFTNNKFALFMGNMVTDVDTNISCTYSNNSIVYMNTVQSNNSADGLLSNTPIEIRVYN